MYNYSYIFAIHLKPAGFILMNSCCVLVQVYHTNLGRFKQWIQCIHWLEDQVVLNQRHYPFLNLSYTLKSDKQNNRQMLKNNIVCFGTIVLSWDSRNIVLGWEGAERGRLDSGRESVKLYWREGKIFTDLKSREHVFVVKGRWFGEEEFLDSGSERRGRMKEDAVDPTLFSDSHNNLLYSYNVGLLWLYFPNETRLVFK